MMWRALFGKGKPERSTENSENARAAIPAGDFSLGQHYPSPASGQTIVPFNLTLPSEVHIMLREEAGAECANHFAGRLPQGANTFLLPLRGIISGAYQCTVIAQNESGSFSHSETVMVK